MTIKFVKPGIMQSEELYIDVDAPNKSNIYVNGVTLKDLYHAFARLGSGFRVELGSIDRLSTPIRIEGSEVPSYDSLIKRIRAEVEYYRPKL
jgi:hypothetical protein